MYTLSVDSNGYSGNSAKIKKIAGSGFCVLQQDKPLTLKPNTTYEFSYWVKTEKATSMKQYVTVRQNKDTAGYLLGYGIWLLVKKIKDRRKGNP